MDNTLFYDISVLPSLLKGSNPLFVTMSAKSLASADKNRVIEQIIAQKKSPHLTYSGLALPVEDIQQLYDKVKENDFSHIVAVGGGTVMDTAKTLAVAFSNHIEKIEDILATPSQFKNLKELIFVPTTCGSGSEATRFAVVYKEKKKYSVTHESIIAQTAILDANLLKSLPLKVRNSTVLDALSQAIESMWAKDGTEKSREYSKKAIALILKGLETDNDTEKLKLFLLGSYFAGKAIDISKTTASHAISYPLTSKFGIPHGIAVFLTLPYLAELNFNAETSNLFNPLFELFKVKKITELRETLKNIMNSLGFSTFISEYGILEKDFESIAKDSIVLGRSDNNPVNIDVETVIKILENANR